MVNYLDRFDREEISNIGASFGSPDFLGGTMPLLFLNVGEMSKYEGLSGDTISGGGKNVSLYGFGHEIFNFKPYKRKMYGYGRAPHNTIRIEKLGATKEDQRVPGVTVVWVARSHIVGWYTNATVYRHPQAPPPESERVFKGKPIDYNVTAQKFKRIDRDDRWMPVPRAKERRHAMGRNLWYAEGPSNASFRKKVERYIHADGNFSATFTTRRAVKARGGSGTPRQPDIDKKQRVERVAMHLSKRHFAALNYRITPVHKDNLGWDMEARKAGVTLRVEVKGLSGRDLCVEVTPNEYAMMRKHKHAYRICIATNCLSKRRALSVFAFSEELGKWTDEDDRPLQLKIIESARLFV
jgi:uncharacterized protein DUF3883